MSRKTSFSIWPGNPAASSWAAAPIFCCRMNRDVLNIFIYAPYKARLENCVNTLEMSEEDAKRTIMKVDKARSAYHKRYAGYSPADPLHKHLMIDSSLLGVEGTADLIAEIVRAEVSLKLQFET